MFACLYAFNLQVENIVPGAVPSSAKGPIILVVSKADGDEEVCFFFSYLNALKGIV